MDSLECLPQEVLEPIFDRLRWVNTPQLLALGRTCRQLWCAVRAYLRHWFGATDDLAFVGAPAWLVHARIVWSTCPLTQYILIYVCILKGQRVPGAHGVASLLALTKRSRLHAG